MDITNRKTRKARKTNDEKNQILEDKKIYYKNYYQKNKNKIQQAIKDNILYAKKLVEDLNNGSKNLKNIIYYTIKIYNITYDTRNKKYVTGFIQSK